MSRIIELTHEDISKLLNFKMWKEDEIGLSEEEKILSDKLYDLYAWTVKENIKIKEINQG